jgi:hypothetical protein
MVVGRTQVNGTPADRIFFLDFFDGKGGTGGKDIFEVGFKKPIAMNDDEHWHGEVGVNGPQQRQDYLQAARAAANYQQPAGRWITGF